MRVKYILSTVALTVLAGAAYAGLVQPAPVTVDLANRTALGDQLTARRADNDIELIGCGIRIFDDQSGPFEFGFCQATDSAGVVAFCFTQSPALLESMRSTSAYAFITFAWNENDECIRIGFSTQSFYLPDPDIKHKGK
uniref:Uncharacterized protein n=1 Tax=uncultured marine microorganism TaxID=415540 RepID=A5CFW1_9ZZZZ|nr:hypothetical protein [uncultured marine microorganism]